MLVVLLLERCSQIWFLEVKNCIEILKENQRNPLKAWGTGKAGVVI